MSFAVRKDEKHSNTKKVTEKKPFSLFYLFLEYFLLCVPANRTGVIEKHYDQDKKKRMCSYSKMITALENNNSSLRVIHF